MYCPVCDQVKMREVEKHGVLIDVCPSCKGVWLDRGELEKLMESAREIRQPFNEWYEHYQPYGQHSGHYPKHKYKKKKTFFDIFDDLFD